MRTTPEIREPLQVEWEGIYPTLTDLTLHGGVPGCEYRLTHSSNTAKAQADGWKLTQGYPVFVLKGWRGIASAQLMVRGSPIPGADPYNGVREFFIDRRLDAETGIDQPEPTGPLPSFGPDGHAIHYDDKPGAQPGAKPVAKGASVAA